jgi:hypothetical protein
MRKLVSSRLVKIVEALHFKPALSLFFLPLDTRQPWEAETKASGNSSKTEFVDARQFHMGSKT